MAAYTIKERRRHGDAKWLPRIDCPAANELPLCRYSICADYKRVLEARRDALERGVDADEAIMAAARG